MGSPISRFFDDFIDRSLDAARRYPVEVIAGIGVAMVLSSAIAGTEPPEWLGDLLLLAGPQMLVALLAVSTLRWFGVIGSTIRWLATAAVLLVGSGIGVWMLDVNREADMWRWAVLGVLVVAALMATPLLARDREVSKDVRFWRFNTRLLVRVFVCGVYLSLMFAGLSIALLAVDSLLGLSVGDEAFGHLFVWLFVGAYPWMVVAGHDEALDVQRPIPEKATRWIARLGSFLVLPLIAIYLLITYGYGLRVAFTDFAPSNMISPLVIGAGIMGFVGLYLVQPLRHYDGYRLLSRLYQIFPPAFLIVLPLSVWALMERINQYGITEFRYLRMLAVVLFAVLCVQGLVQFIRKETMSLWTIPVVVGLGALVAFVGPLSATNVSKSSQLNRVVSVAEEGGALNDDGTVDAERVAEMSRSERSQIGDAVRYLRISHGADSMDPLVPAGVTAGEWRRAIRESGSYGRANARGKQHAMDWHRFDLGEDPKITTTGRLSSVSFRQGPADTVPSHRDEWFDFEERRLVVEREEGTYYASLAELLDAATEQVEEGSIEEGTLPQRFETVPLVTERGGDEVGELVVESLTVRVDEDGEVKFSSFSGWVIVGE